MKTLNFSKIDKALNVLFSFGAAVVIFGATAKILHWRSADVSIMTGLLTEVAIFITMGIVEWARPKEKPVETTRATYSAGHSVPQLNTPDISQEMILFRSQLDRINKMMANILNSNKH